MGSTPSLAWTVSYFSVTEKMSDTGWHVYLTQCNSERRGYVTYPEPPSVVSALPRNRASSVRGAVQLRKTVLELPRPDEGLCGQRSLKVCPPLTGQPVSSSTLLTYHQPQRRVMDLLLQDASAGVVLLLYSSLH